MIQLSFLHFRCRGWSRGSSRKLTDERLWAQKQTGSRKVQNVSKLKPRVCWRPGGRRTGSLHQPLLRVGLTSPRNLVSSFLKQAWGFFLAPEAEKRQKTSRRIRNETISQICGERLIRKKKIVVTYFESTLTKPSSSLISSHQLAQCRDFTSLYDYKNRIKPFLTF